MTPDYWEQIKTIFFDALDCDAGERAAFLDAACTDDPVLRQEVDALLAVDERSQGLLLESRLLADEDPASADPDPLPGTRIGPYRVKERIGQGGMGAVYLAERADDFTRQVALKLIRPGWHTAEVVARFRVERQILAHLEHPNIARLLDGGMTEDGQPYLVMEHVAGTPLTAFCNAHRLSIAARLRLFQTVCQAVQYAHRNLVVHRDLKPSNILVTDDGRVKLLDFGIAKLLDPASANVSALRTRPEVRLLTPEYAAPEQVRGEAVTTAADVYALGALLYELLTGHRPYRLPQRRQAEVERIICEATPTRPSTIVAEVEEVTRADGTTETLTLERVSAARATPPARLRRLLQGDLDTIVMMALRKEPERRYASAEQLAEDIGRYLDGRPVIARKDTLAYRAGKFVRRNRVGVGVATAFLVLLVGFSAVTARQARRVARERDLAQQEARKAEQVTAFMLSLFESAAPVTAPRDTMRVRDVLEAGAGRAEALAGQPAVQAQLFNVLSQAYWRLGRPDRAAALEAQALSLLRNLYGARHPETANSLYWMGVLREEQHEFEKAHTLYREALAAHHALYGDEHLAVAKDVYRIGLILHQTGRGAAADSLFAQWNDALERAAAGDDPDVAVMLGDMGVFLQYKGRLDEAESHLRQALAMTRRIYGDRHYRVGADLNSLTNVLLAQQRPEEAEVVAREALALHRALFPEGHAALANSLGGLGEALRDQERYAEAEPLLREALDTYRRLYGDDHPIAGNGYTLLAQLYHQWGRYDAAEPLYRQMITLYERQFGRDYPITIQRRLMLADLLRDRGDHAAAESILLASYQTLLTQRGRADRYTQGVLKRLVRLYEGWGRPDEAARYR